MSLIKRDKMIATEEKTELDIQFIAHESGRAFQSETGVTTRLSIAARDHPTDTADGDFATSDVESMSQHADMADRTARLFDDEVKLLGSPLQLQISQSEEVLTPLKELPSLVFLQTVSQSD